MAERKANAKDAARAQLSRQLAGAHRAAPDAGRHPGHWELHHMMLPEERPGDFTPIPQADHAEHEEGPHRDLFRLLAEMFGLEHEDLLAQYGLQKQPEAGQ